MNSTILTWLRRGWDTGVAGSIGFLAVLSHGPVVHFTIFQVRDFSRAMELVRGHPIFFGPEGTGGGILPGPLYSLLLAIPLGLGGGWWTVWILMSLCASYANVCRRDDARDAPPRGHENISQQRGVRKLEC
jgi:hypothetical protein